MTTLLPIWIGFGICVWLWSAIHISSTNQPRQEKEYPLYVVEIDKDLDLDQEELEEVRNDFEKYRVGNERFIVTHGLSVKQLKSKLVLERGEVVEVVIPYENGSMTFTGQIGSFQSETYVEPLFRTVNWPFICAYPGNESRKVMVEFDIIASTEF